MTISQLHPVVTNTDCAERQCALDLGFRNEHFCD